jgi:2-methylisocitrate lyase-like PEP mutase family enzyme
MVADELGDWPLVANMVEWGKTPLLSAEELGELGFSLILFPGSVTRTVTRAARETLDELRNTGTTMGRLDEMATFDEVNRVVGLTEADEFERAITDAESDGS